MIDWKERGKASGIHLGISLAIAAFVDPATADVIAFMPLDPF